MLPRAKISQTRQTLQALQPESKKRQQKQNPPLQSIQKHMDHRAQKSQGSNNRNTSKSSTAPQNQHPNVTTWKHHKAPKGVQYLFITISLLEKLSFPLYLQLGTRSKGSAPTWESNIATKTMVRSSEWGLPSK